MPDNLTIKLNFEKELQSVQYKKREERDATVLFICESNGYRADPVMIEKIKQAAMQREILKEQTIEEAEQQADQASEQFRNLQGQMNGFMSAVASNLERTSDDLSTKLDQAVEQHCSRLEKVADKLCAKLDHLVEAVHHNSDQK